MPNLNDSAIFSQENTSTPVSYDELTGVEDTRSHISQLVVLYDFGTTDANGVDFSGNTFKNWYDPYALPVTALTVDQSLSQIVVGDITTRTFADINGNQFQTPAFDLTSGNSCTVIRSQNVNNIAQVFGAGSRVTSKGLNNGFGQVFDSVQELTDRITQVEGFNFKVPVDISGGGGDGNLTPGDKGDVVVSLDLNTWTVQDDSHSHTIANVDGLQAELDTKTTEQEAADAAPIQSITAGNANITITDPLSDGNIEISGTGSSSGGGTLSETLVSTETLGGISSGDTFAVGEPLEDVLVALLVTYQPPGVSSLNPLGSEIEVGSSYNIGTVNFNITNRQTANAAATMLFRRGGSTLNSQAITLTGTTGTAGQSHAFSPAASGSYTITSGTSQQYSVRVQGTNTQSGSFSGTDTITVKYRSFAFPSTSTTASGAIANIEDGNDDLTTSTNVTLTATGTDSGGRYSWIAFPRDYFSGTPSITVTDLATGFAAAHNYIGDQNYTNAQGTVVSMALFRSPFSDSITSGTPLDID